jgi:NitT/TauT family transport system substrate-binding protein
MNFLLYKMVFINIVNFSIVVTAVFMAGCSQVQSGPTVRLAIAAQQSPTQMLTYLAAELGEFQRAGIKVNLEEFSGSSKAMEALLGGSVDVVSGYHEQTLQLGQEAPPLVSFLVMQRSPMVALAVSPKSGRKIQSTADLRGANIGVTSLGSATHLLLNHWLRQAGMKPDDVQPVAISTGSRALAAMERGLVDAGVVSDFTIRHLEKRFGAVTVLADTRTEEDLRQTYGTDSYPSTVLFARKDWLEANRDLAWRLVQAIVRTREWVRAKPPEEVARRLPASHHGDDEAIYVEVIRGTMSMLHPSGRMSEEEAAAAARAAAGKRAAEESYTNEFVDRR